MMPAKKLTSDDVQGILSSVDNRVVEKINELVDLVNSGGILQDLQSVLDEGSSAALTAPMDLNFGALDAFDLVSGLGTIHDAFDISSVNAYGPAYPPRDPASVKGASSLAAGYLNDVSGYAAAALAGLSEASGSYALARGEECEAKGWGATAIGYQCKANEGYALAVGQACEATYWSAIAMGGFCLATAATAVAIGNGYLSGGTIRLLQARGQGSYNFSTVNGSYGATQRGAEGVRSGIWGGLNHEIKAGATEAQIYGGRAVVMDATALRSIALGLNGATITDPDKVYQRNLNIWDDPAQDDALTHILARDPATKETKFVDKATIGGGGGGVVMDQSYFVATNGNDVTGDGSPGNPFQTIQHALDQVGSPTDAATAAEQWSVFVMPGYYDEDLAIPAGRILSITAMGPVVLGDGLVPTTARDLTYVVDDTKEFGGVRPVLTINSIDAGEVSSTHVARAGSFFISGDFIRTSVSGVSSHDAVLKGVKVGGNYTSVDGGATLGQHSLYVYNSYFDNAIIGNGPTAGAVYIQRMIDTEVDGDITVNKVGLVRYCEFDGNITVAAGPSGDLPPYGFRGCDFGGNGNTFTGPAGSFPIDQACYSLPTLAGGATSPFAGITGDRPVFAAEDVGEMYFDTTLGLPVWWDGSGWVDATGAPA